MKKLFLCVLSFIVLVGCTNKTVAKDENVSGGNFSDEMKIEKLVNLDSDYGADSIEREGDHKDSPYFSRVDFYNATSNDTLTILPKFATIQQSCEWSCGVDAVLMVINYFGNNSENEETLAERRFNKLEAEATTLASVVKIFDELGGYDVVSTFDYEPEKLKEEITLEWIEKQLKDGKPILVAWNDWGGHWQTIVGYDNMGTEFTSDDVIIMADSYDTTDHNQDGYMVYGAERFYYNWTMYDFFSKHYGVDNERDMLFAVVSPKK